MRSTSRMQTWPRLTLLVNSKRAEKRSCIQRSKARKTEPLPLVKRTPVALEVDCRDLTNRVSCGHVCGGGVSKPVATAAVLNLMMAVVEAAAGVRSGSVSLLVDSVHNLSDEMALIWLFLAFIPPAGLSRNLRICERKEVHVNTTRILAVAALIVASAVAPHVALAQALGIKRTDLQRHDFSVPGREVIQVLVEFAP